MLKAMLIISIASGRHFFFILFLKLFLLESSCFTISCSFLLYSEVNQLDVYIYIPSSLDFPFIQVATEP